MKFPATLAVLLENFFTQRLMNQRQASPHTISSYRDTFRLLLQFAQKRLHKPPARLAFQEIDAPMIAAFLDDLEKSRGIIHPRWGTPYVSLLLQAVVATLFLLIAQLGETVRAAYQIMVDMMVIVTFIPFLYIFGSGFRFISRISAVSGIAVTLIAIVLSALPPAESGSAAVFEIKVLGGTLLCGLLGLTVFWRYQTRRVATRAAG